MKVRKYRSLLAAAALFVLLDSITAQAACPPPGIFGQLLRYTASLNGWEPMPKELDQYLSGSGISSSVDTLAAWIPECVKKLDPADLACASSYLEIIKKKKPESENTLELDLDDDTYRKKYLSGYLDRIPAELKDPELYSNFGKPGAANKIVEKLRKNPGWNVTKISDPDMGDTVIAHIPGKESDLLFQFRVLKNGKLKFPNSITILKEEDGKKLDRPKLIYEGLSVEKISISKGASSATKLQLTSTPHDFQHVFTDDPGKPGSCFNCHMGGFQYLIPDRQAGEINKRAAFAINSLLLGYGITEQVGVSRDVDPKTNVSLRLGPPLGPVDPPERTAEFIRSCATPGLSADSINRIGRAMNCSSCHDGKRILEKGTPVDLSRLPGLYKNGSYELKPIYAMSEIDNFMLHRVIQKNGTMPYDENDLNQEEKDSTVSCLLKERDRSFLNLLEPPGCRIFSNDKADPVGVLTSVLKAVTPPQGTPNVRDTGNKAEDLDVHSIGLAPKSNPRPAFTGTPAT
jgi:hypothetical protein